MQRLKMERDKRGLGGTFEGDAPWDPIVPLLSSVLQEVLTIEAPETHARHIAMEIHCWAAQIPLDKRPNANSFGLKRLKRVKQVASPHTD